MKITRKIRTANAKHAYELTVKVDGESECWSIWANNRTQAGAIAKRNGASEVCDCNMVG